MKDDLSQKIHGNMIFSVYWEKIVSLFASNMLLPFFPKSKDILLSKNTLKDDISGIIQKDDIHPRKYGISSDRKIKDDKKVCFHKKVPMIFCTFLWRYL